MNESERALQALAARQRQVFSRKQAAAAGLDRNALRRRLTRGDFVSVGTRSLTFAGVTLDWRGRLTAGLIDLAPGALVAAESAAALHGLDGFDEGPLVFLLPREARGRSTTGTVITGRDLSRLDHVRVDGLTVTSGTRTIIDLLGRVDERRLGNAYDSARRKGITAESAVIKRLDELGGRGRSCVTDFRALVKSGAVESWLEREFLRVIRAAGLPDPVLQRVHRDDSKFVARVDFEFEPYGVIVEVGGQRGYLSLDERRRKEQRRNELQLLGKVVYFFCTEDVRETPQTVVATVRQALLGGVA